MLQDIAGQKYLHLQQFISAGETDSDKTGGGASDKTGGNAETNSGGKREITPTRRDDP